MKIEVGYGEVVYGTISESTNGLLYDGENIQAMQNLLKSMRRDGQGDHDLLQSLPTRLKGRVWAKTVTIQDEHTS